MTLENILKNVKENHGERAAKVVDVVYNYSVDVLSGWLYYTPTYALQEIAAGKDIETVAKTRLIGMAAHTIAMRPTGLLRNYFANKWNVTEGSPLIDKIKVNLVAVTPIQSVVYASMLLGGMAWSGNYDWKASLYAWGVGVGLGAFHAFPYGYVQDKVRSFCGVTPAIAEKD